MVTNQETTVKVSKWLIKEVEGYLGSSLKNQTEFPSKRNFVDKAIIELLEKGVENLMMDEERIAYARALFEKLEGISRQRSSIDEARRNYRILELMSR